MARTLYRDEMRPCAACGKPTEWVLQCDGRLKLPTCRDNQCEAAVTAKLKEKRHGL